MRGGRQRAFSGAAIVAALLVSRAAAADGTEPIRLHFDAPGDCSNADAFMGQVKARTAKARLANPNEAARYFTVTVTRDKRGSRGKLTIEEPSGGPPAVREVRGDPCEEVVNALALVAALAIDPHASTAAKVVIPPPPPLPPPPPVEKHPPPPRFAGTPWWGPIAYPLPALYFPPPPPYFRFSYGLHVTAQSGLSPHLVPVLAGYVDVARIGAGVLSPSIRLSLLKADSGVTQGGGGARARFQWTAARVELCPIRLGLFSSLTAIPCAHFEAGAIDAQGFGRAFSARASRPWAAPGAMARLEWDLFGRALVEFGGGIGFPLVRDRFVFRPQPTVLEVPVAAGVVGGGLGIHFP